MIFTYTLKKIAPVSKNVCLWNTWDHEHLHFVHKQFRSAHMMFESPHCAILKTKVSIPIIPIPMSCTHCLFQLENQDVQVIDFLPFGVTSKLKMEFREIDSKKTELINTYQLEFPFIFFPLKFILKKIINKWNANNWEEDMPLKIRRQEAVDLGFRDFKGIDHRLAGQNKLVLPLGRTPDSIISND